MPERLILLVPGPVETTVTHCELLLTELMPFTLKILALIVLLSSSAPIVWVTPIVRIPGLMTAELIFMATGRPGLVTVAPVKLVLDGLVRLRGSLSVTSEKRP